MPKTDNSSTINRINSSAINRINKPKIQALSTLLLNGMSTTKEPLLWLMQDHLEFTTTEVPPLSSILEIPMDQDLSLNPFLNLNTFQCLNPPLNLNTFRFLNPPLNPNTSRFLNLNTKLFPTQFLPLKWLREDGWVLPYMETIVMMKMTSERINNFITYNFQFFWFSFF